jgi:hypothetical protein
MASEREIMADLAAVEEGLIALYRRVNAHCANSHQAHHDLGLARDHFVDGLFRLRRAVESHDTAWVVRHG